MQFKSGSRSLSCLLNILGNEKMWKSLSAKSLLCNSYVMVPLLSLLLHSGTEKKNKMGRKNPHDLEICVCYRLMCFTVWNHTSGLWLDIVKKNVMPWIQLTRLLQSWFSLLATCLPWDPQESDSFHWNCFRTWSCVPTHIFS